MVGIAFAAFAIAWMLALTVAVVFQLVALTRAWFEMPATCSSLSSRQIDLKERAAAANTASWTRAVEKVRNKQAAFTEQAAVASRLKLAEPVRAPATPPLLPVSPATNEPPRPPRSARSKRFVRGRG
jgi:hypothetical protein